MVNLHIHSGELTSSIKSLEDYFCKGRVSIIEAAFAHSYFVHPDAVREKTPYFPDRARYSREHYGRLAKGATTTWSGDGREVRLDDNQRAQMAWERYTGHPLERGKVYSVRHIWGNPWDPDFFTAGWNRCYMPFWAGMLTEKQHPHPKLEKAILQASWDLYFKNNPVCQPPNLVENPGLDLTSLLAGQPILILDKSAPYRPEGIVERVRAIRSESHQSWSNIRKAVRALQDLDHEPFGTLNVENSAKSCMRKMCSETGLSLAQLETLMDSQGW